MEDLITFITSLGTTEAFEYAAILESLPPLYGSNDINDVVIWLDNAHRAWGALKTSERIATWQIAQRLGK